MFDLTGIRLISPYRIEQIKGCHIKIVPGEHGKLSINGTCSHDARLDKMVKAGDDGIQLMCEGKTLFSGIIAQATIEQFRDVRSVSLEAVTYTACMDIRLSSRSFQDIGMNYSEMISAITDAYPDSDFMQHVGDEKLLPHPYIQHRETDWDFFKRIAAQLHTVLIADSVGTAPRFHIGLPEGREYNLPEDMPYEVGKDILSFQLVAGENAELDDSDFLYYKVKQRQMFAIGDRVAFLKEHLRVTSIEGHLEKGELIFTYTLARPKSLYRKMWACESLKGCSIKGRVIDTKGENVRLHLDIDKEQNKDKAYWFPYAPITGNMMYCMPEIGTSAHLYFANGREATGKVIDCIRENGGICGKTSDPNSRYLSTAQGKEMALLTGSMSLADMTAPTHGALRLELDDGYGIKMTSHSNLRIGAGGGIGISTPGTVTIMAPTYIKVKEGLKDTRSIITLENEIHAYGMQSLLRGRDRTAYPPFDDDPKRLAKSPKKRIKKDSDSKNGDFNPFEAAVKAIAAVAVVAVVAIAAAVVEVKASPFPLIAAVAAIASVATAVIPAIIAAKITYDSDKVYGTVRSLGEYVTQAFRGWKVGNIAVGSIIKSGLENYTGLDFGDDRLGEEIRRCFGNDLQNISDEDGIYFVGFNYDKESGAFYASEMPPQRGFGYLDFYDFALLYLNMNLDREVIEFTIGEYDYKIEFWKGQYGPSIGGEVGIYRRPTKKNGAAFDYYSSVPSDGEIGMSFILKSNGDSGASVDTATIDHGDWDSHKDTSFWEPVFIPGVYEKPEDLTMEIKLTFPENMIKVGDAFKETVKDDNNTFKGGAGNNFSYDDKTNTATLTWSTATTPRQTLAGVVEEEVERLRHYDSIGKK